MQGPYRFTRRMSFPEHHPNDFAEIRTTDNGNFTSVWRMQMIANVNKTTIAEYFGRLDGLVASGTTLYIYGGAAVAALGANITVRYGGSGRDG